MVDGNGQAAPGRLLSRGTMQLGVDYDDAIMGSVEVPSFDDFELWLEVALGVLLAVAEQGQKDEGNVENARPPESDVLLQALTLVARDTADLPPDGAANNGPSTLFEISMRIVTEAEIQILNRQYRLRDRPTNVLSFSSGLPPLPGMPALLSLGDIVLCPAVINREAAAQGKAVADHWAHLSVHGLLHLAGYDHEDAATAQAMESLEIRILSNLSIANPYLQPSAEQTLRSRADEEPND